MKKVLKIFVHDLVGLSRNIFALIIAVGLCIIPSLYAWFNIYSNWDPYANTSSIKVAVVSQDAGYKNSDGKNVNMGEEVLDTLRKNTGLGWQILGTYDEAIDGVKSGKYYAAIVLGEDFSKNMFDFIDNGLVHPSVTYYENEKKNAVASKITQSGKSTLQENINTQFVDTVVQTAMGSTDGILSEDKDILSGVTESLKKLNSNLSGYNTTITAFVNSNNALQGTLNQVKNEIPQVQQVLLDGSDTTQKIHEQTSAAADEYIQKIDELSSLIRQTSKELSEQIHKLIDSVQNNAGTDEIIAGINSAQNLLDALSRQNLFIASPVQCLHYTSLTFTNPNLTRLNNFTINLNQTLPTFPQTATRRIRPQTRPNLSFQHRHPGIHFYLNPFTHKLNPSHKNLPHFQSKHHNNQQYYTTP